MKNFNFLTRTIYFQCFFFVMSAFLQAEGTQPDFSKYQPATFKQFEATLSKKETPTKDHQLFYDARRLPLAIKAKFLGKLQNIPHVKKDLFIKQDTSKTLINGLYDKEVLMQSEGLERWVPIQRQMEELFVKEVKAGNSITLYVRYIGSFRDQGKIERVYFMTEFQ